MWLILLTIVIITVIITWKILVDWSRPSLFPPGPPGLPFLNNIYDLKLLVRRTGSHSKAWCELAKEYGAVVGLRLGLADPMIVVSGREAVMEMLGRSEFDGRPNGFIFTHRTMGEKRGILFTDGKVWADQRRFSLINLKSFGWAGQTMEELILEDAENLGKIIEKVSQEHGGIVQNLKELTALAVLNSLWSLFGGSRYDIGKCEPKLLETLRMLNDSVKESNVSGGLLNYLPFLRLLAPKLSGYEAIHDRLLRMWAFFAEEVKSHKKTRKEGINRDLIDAYLEEIETRRKNPDSTFNEMQLIALLKDFFAAGVDTTNNSIGFTIGYLTLVPEVQDKVQEELDRVIGKDNLPSLSSRNSLPYLNATLAEVLRLANIGPTTIPHRATKDTLLNGYVIKKNYTILANLMSVHQDVDHWGDPEVFRPERFIDASGQFIPDAWVIPFGSGRRKCIGETLAKNSHFLFIAYLLQKFKFALAPGQSRPSMTGMDGFALAPPIFKILITKR
ncbi:methyl farnesoate epoxidase-like isoform X1 [Cotesia glomerata]|uniref:methyl farnesoate epoxidase-like isoform X1 n=2 Tax=Cotesia glomerata TaxID=32391 RepID=UPI001D01E9A2|nr:methyl farnesoate epoxidase-like isoform X1 [Cotesia glomerata]